MSTGNHTISEAIVRRYREIPNQPYQTFRKPLYTPRSRLNKGWVLSYQHQASAIN